MDQLRKNYADICFAVLRSYNVIRALLHFTSSCFEANFTADLRAQVGYGRRRLNKDAVPALLTEKCESVSKRKGGGAATLTLTETWTCIPVGPWTETPRTKHTLTYTHSDTRTHTHTHHTHAHTEAHARTDIPVSYTHLTLPTRLIV